MGTVSANASLSNANRLKAPLAAPDAHCNRQPNRVNSKHEIAYWHYEKGWTSGTLGGSVKEDTSPAATVNTFNGHMYVYYVNSSGELATFSYNGATWTGPTTLGGKVASNSGPTAFLNSNNQYVYFFNGSNEVETFTNTGEWAGPSFP